MTILPHFSWYAVLAVQASIIGFSVSLSLCFCPRSASFLFLFLPHSSLLFSSKNHHQKKTQVIATYLSNK